MPRWARQRYKCRYKADSRGAAANDDDALARQIQVGSPVLWVDNLPLERRCARPARQIAGGVVIIASGIKKEASRDCNLPRNGKAPPAGARVKVGGRDLVVEADQTIDFEICRCVLDVPAAQREEQAVSIMAQVSEGEYHMSHIICDIGRQVDGWVGGWSGRWAGWQEIYERCQYRTLALK